MSKQVWMCEKCGRLVDSQAAADECEAAHLPIVSAEALSWCKEYCHRPFPELIKARVAVDSGYDYAVYELKHVGPIPV